MGAYSPLATSPGGKSSLLKLGAMCCVLILCVQPAATAVSDRDSAVRLGEEIISKPRVSAQYSLRASVEVALRNFPSINNARQKVNAARANVTLARTAYLPNFNLQLQEMRSTQNVIAGTLMPQGLTGDVIPVQSGTESKSSTFRSIWSNSAGANFNWLLYDFGLRRSNVEMEQANTRMAQANVRLTLLDVAYAAANTYLATVAADQTIRAQQAALNRFQAAALVVHTMVKQGLRPGVDAARADYEVSQAKINLIRAERDTELARVELAERMGMAGTYISIISDPFIRHPAEKIAVGATHFEAHPLAQVNAAGVKTLQAKVQVLDKTWYPHIWLNSAMWGRGSGASGQSPPVAGGVIPQVGNYMAGISVGFPVMEIFEIKARRRAAVSEEMGQRANYELAIQILEKEDARARVLLMEALRVANETPTLVQAARENEIKAMERYKLGLSNIVAISEAEEILAKAEVEDALAQLEVWRSILAVGYAQGSLQPFMAVVAAAEGKRE
jgi:outer membrane protein